MNKFKLPIVVFFFKRHHIFQTLQQVKKVKPKKLYLVSDGGRNKEEHLECMKIRKEVEKMIDWNCNIVKKYYDTNQGVDVIIPRTITEIFKTEEKLIILEDDCVASLSFFKFCEVLLEKYKYNDKIMSISGTNWFDNKYFSDKSYFFSIHPESSGCATWKRAWNLYDNEMKLFKNEKENSIIKDRIKSNFLYNRYYELFKYHYQAIRNGDWKNSHWDGKWLYTLFVNNGLSIVPNKNLISNIGFDESATHTIDSSHFMANKKKYEIDFPLKDNNKIEPNREYDILYAKKILGFGILNYIRNSLILFLKTIYLYKPLKSIYRTLKGKQ